MIIKKLGICQKPRTKMWARIVPVTPKTRICKAPKTRICKASDRTESKMGGGDQKPKTKKNQEFRARCFLCLSILFLSVDRFYYYFFCRKVLPAPLSTLLGEAAQSKLPLFTRCQQLADWSSDHR